MEVTAKPRTVDAIQFTGPTSVTAIQAFLAPASPLYNGEGTTIQVETIDRVAMKTWPSLGRQFAQVTVHIDSWIVRHADGFSVLTDEEMRRTFDIPEAPPAPEAPPDFVPEETLL